LPCSWHCSISGLATGLPNPNIFGGRAHASAPNHFNPGFWAFLDRLSRTSNYFEIADGGNFENLGVYELLRREVLTIVVCDATADPDTAFADLQNLLSRAEADFGVTITFIAPPLEALMPTQEQGRFPFGAAFAREPFVIGDIGYPNGCRGTTVLYKTQRFSSVYGCLSSASRELTQHSPTTPL